LPGTGSSTAQRKPSGVTHGRRTQARGARAALDGEHAVVRWRETARPPIPRPLHPLAFGKRSAQAYGPKTLRDQSQMAVTQYEARGAAREPDGETPGGQF